MAAIFTQHIRHGSQQGTQRERVIKFLTALEATEKMEYTISVSKFNKSKTAAQLGYYWGVVVPEFMRFQGCSSNEADQALKTELVPPIIKEIMGITIEVRTSIAKMKVKEMSEYIDLCVNFMGTWGVSVPSPPYKPQEG